jgi:hypothetical protein
MTLRTGAACKLWFFNDLALPLTLCQDTLYVALDINQEPSLLFDRAMAFVFQQDFESAFRQPTDGRTSCGCGICGA